MVAKVFWLLSFLFRELWQWKSFKKAFYGVQKTERWRGREDFIPASACSLPQPTPQRFYLALLTGWCGSSFWNTGREQLTGERVSSDLELQGSHSITHHHREGVATGVGGQLPHLQSGTREEARYGAGL